MTQDEVLQVFRNCGALLSGHFVLSSGKHSDTYLQCALVLADPVVSERLCRELAVQWSDSEVDTVVGPALGGVVLAYELARELGCRGIFAERKASVMELRRGFSIGKGERVLVAEDVVTTGGSALEVVELVKEAGGETVGVTSLIDRGGGQNFPCSFGALARVLPPTYEAGGCPLCSQGVPIVRPGSRTEGGCSSATGRDR